MLNVIYTIKICLLVMYSRLTLGLGQQIAINYLSIYVGIGWLATEFTFFLACRPFRGYWAVPPPSSQCATLQRYAIVQGIFNMSSDFGMILIPLPLVLGMTIPWRQKIVLVIIFGMGIFVMIAALLTKVFNLSNVWDPSYMRWYARESSVAIYVSNLPMIWPLIREWFPWLGGLKSNQSPATNPYAYPTTNRSGNHVSNIATGVTGIPLSRRLRSYKDRNSLQSYDDTAFAIARSKESQGRVRSADARIWDEHDDPGCIQEITPVHVREVPVASSQDPVSAFDIGTGKDIYGWEHDGLNGSRDSMAAWDDNGTSHPESMALPSRIATTTLSQTALAVGCPTAKPLSKEQDANINEQLKRFEKESREEGPEELEDKIKYAVTTRAVIR